MEIQISEEMVETALIQRHGLAVQQRLREGRVAIAGLGGLGSAVAVALARVGVGHLQLVDMDRVELTNLNRQQYCLHHIGRYKTEALLEQLQVIHPYLDYRIDTVQVTAENFGVLFAQADIIVEAFDQPEAKAMLVDSFFSYGRQEQKLVSASGMAGYGSSNTIVTRKKNQRWYLCGDGISDIALGMGLMAPRVAICAAHEANMVLRLLLEEQEP